MGINPDELVEDKCIYYKEGYKYQLDRRLVVFTNIFGYTAKTEFIELFSNGFMIIEKHYAWDGASGPTIDTLSSMRCSAGHDALFQLCRLGYLPKELQYKFDEYLERVGIEDGMWHVRAHIWEKMLNKFGRVNLNPSSERPVLVAP